MKTLGIIRRLDDLGRVIIPRVVYKNLGWEEGEELEVFVEEDMICFKKYETPKANLQKLCAEWVDRNKNLIVSVNVKGNEIFVVFKDVQNTIKAAEVTHNPKDNYDINVAICYCAKKCGFMVEGL